MAKTELKNINTSIRQGNRMSLGCGATYIASGTGLVKGDWVAIQATSAADVVLMFDGTSETVVDWDNVSADHTLESTPYVGNIFYGNFTAIQVSAGTILAYKRCS